MGNSNNTLGASNLSQKERAKHDFYSTDPSAVKNLLENVRFKGGIWEPYCGSGCISIPLEEQGYDVLSTDLYNHGYGIPGHDFFNYKEMPHESITNIVTNPPYSRTNDFICHALDLIPEGGCLALLLRTQYLEGIERYERIYKENPPALILQYVNRIKCNEMGKIGDKFTGSSVAYAWYIWIKGEKKETRLRWVLK